MQNDLHSLPHAGGLTILNGWKEIAKYIGRGVRTAQRWESRLGLPIHRPNGARRSAVFALREELDHWVAAAPMRDSDPLAVLAAKVARLEAENKMLRRQLSAIPRPEHASRSHRAAS